MKRRGAVVIVALVCLALIAALGGALLRWALMEHKLLLLRERESQARWLAEAGIERAAARLAADRDFTDETWKIDAAELPEGEPALVSLHVANGGGERTIAVDVEYPTESDDTVRVHKQIVYQLQPSEGA